MKRACTVQRWSSLMKIFTCYVPKKFICSPKIQKIKKCVEIKVIKPKCYDTYKPLKCAPTNGELA
jgi:hypothetical protein